MHEQLVDQSRLDRELEKICDGVLDEVRRRSSGAQRDDATVVVVKFI